MKIDVIRSVEGLSKLRGDWQGLQETDGTLPFTSWEWNLAWWKHLARRRLSMTDRLFVHSFRSEGGELLAVAPLMLTSLPAMGPRFRCLQFFGADKNLTEIRGILCRRGLEAEVHAKLLDRLMTRGSKWDCFLAEGYRDDGAVPFLLARQPRVKFLESRSDLIVTLPKSWDEFRAARSRNVKESLRKCVNSLKRDGLTPTFGVATKGPELTTALDALFRLHGARASLKHTVVHANAFGASASRAFVRELCERLSDVGGVRVFSMNIGDRTVATRLAFSVGRSLYLYYSGYDPEYGKYSVMTSVVAHAIQYAIAHGYEQVNLSTGVDVSKTRWSPDAIPFGSAMVLSDGARARFVTRGYFLLRSAWRASGWAADGVTSPQAGASSSSATPK